MIFSYGFAILIVLIIGSFNSSKGNCKTNNFNNNNLSEWKITKISNSTRNYSKSKASNSRIYSHQILPLDSSYMQYWKPLLLPYSYSKGHLQLCLVN